MTPEERAVIQAAISAHAIGSREPSVAQQNVLRTAVHQLIFACPECNAGGHTCPGDGVQIAHGDVDCGEHKDISPEEDGALRDELAAIENLGPPRWVESIWLYVLPEDRIKLPGGKTEAVVTAVTKNEFHTKVDTWNDRHTGKPRDNVTGRWDHFEVRASLEGVTRPGEMLEFPAGDPILILAGATRRAMFELQYLDPIGTTVIQETESEVK